MKKYSLEELTDKYIGKTGTIVRERFDFELRADVIGEIIKNARVGYFGETDPPIR